MKELRNRFLQGKTPLMLSKVHDVHVLCGLLKDFLRRLKEPLLTFRLHRTFMEAAGTSSDSQGSSWFLTTKHRKSVLLEAPPPEISYEAVPFLLFLRADE